LQLVGNRPEALHELEDRVMQACGPPVVSTFRRHDGSVSRPFEGPVGSRSDA
jgi:hypothetical protein